MDKSEISNDYKDLYSFYSEGDTSNFILESLNKINLGKDKSYLDFACGKDNRTLNLLNKNGYDVYGYDLYTNMDHPKFIKNTFKVDVVYTNNYIEHLIDPFNDLKKVIDLLKDDGKLVIISQCWEYCIDITHYHTFYFLGKSLNYLCNELNINEIYSDKIFFTDNEDNEWSIIKIFEKKSI
jgi:SAM-dependent methyltransferase